MAPAVAVGDTTSQDSNETKLAKLAKFDAESDVTLEVWAEPVVIGSMDRLIHHHSANSKYLLALASGSFGVSIQVGGLDKREERSSVEP